jgi:phosphohistidine phosphatase
MIELILWRHADAEEGWPDLKRQLTAHGIEQARQTAAWLAPLLPKNYWLLCSPAERARQTAAALTNDIRIDERLIPGASVKDYTAPIEWPDGPQGCPGVMIVVGHQPILGALAARLLTGQNYGWTFEKSGIWWFSAREPDARGDTVLKAVMSPTLLRATGV